MKLIYCLLLLKLGQVGAFGHIASSYTEQRVLTIAAKSLRNNYIQLNCGAQDHFTGHARLLHTCLQLQSGCSHAAC
jgi:hypothetical protein